MICINCTLPFDIDDHLKIGTSDGDSAQFVTKCPKCNYRYYAFTSGHWASMEHAERLIASEKKRRQQSRS